MKTKREAVVEVFEFFHSLELIRAFEVSDVGGGVVYLLLEVEDV